MRTPTLRVVLLAEGFEAQAPIPAWDEVPLALQPLGDRSVFDRLLDEVELLDAADVVLVVRDAPEAWRLALRGRREAIRVAYPLRGPRQRTLTANVAPTGLTLLVDARCVVPARDMRAAVDASASGRRTHLTTSTGDVAQVWAPMPAAAGPGSEAAAAGRARRVGVRLAASARSLAELHTSGLALARRGGLSSFAMGEGARVDPAVAATATGPVWIGPGAVVEAGARLDGPVVVGPRSRVRAGAHLRETVVLADTDVGAIALHRSLAAGDRCWSRDRSFAIRLEDPTWLAPRASTPPPDRRVSALVSRALEVGATGFGLAVISPLLALFAAAVRLDSSGPAFYSSDRLMGPEVTVEEPTGYAHVPSASVPHLVFRTMRVGADRMRVAARNLYAAGPYHKFAEDERVTRVGTLLRKTSVDELPLLVNVLLGRVGLVGLWPLPRSEVELLASRPFPVGDRDLSATARRRFLGTPGIAGMWQAGGRSRVSAEARAVFDAYQAVVHFEGPEAELLEGEYARYATVCGRVRCVLDTALRVVRREGAL